MAVTDHARVTDAAQPASQATWPLRPLHGRYTAVTWPLHGGMHVRGVWCRRHQPPAICLQGGALALLLLLNQWELDVQDPFKRLLGAEFDVEHAGAIGFAATRLLHVEFLIQS